jgi:hypothetical protein
MPSLCFHIIGRYPPKQAIQNDCFFGLLFGYAASVPGTEIKGGLRESRKKAKLACQEFEGRRAAFCLACSAGFESLCIRHNQPESNVTSSVQAFLRLLPYRGTDSPKESREPPTPQQALTRRNNAQ